MDRGTQDTAVAVSWRFTVPQTLDRVLATVASETIASDATIGLWFEWPLEC